MHDQGTKLILFVSDAVEGYSAGALHQQLRQAHIHLVVRVGCVCLQRSSGQRHGRYLFERSLGVSPLLYQIQQISSHGAQPFSGAVEFDDGGPAALQTADVLLQTTQLRQHELADAFDIDVVADSDTNSLHLWHLYHTLSDNLLDSGGQVPQPMALLSQLSDLFLLLPHLLHEHADARAALHLHLTDLHTAGGLQPRQLALLGG
mmetsp:Transcript_36084/g.90008  ORF Transcript_36084/g.90008 Transcript_36084/m.90008 type:complete len:204 (+) Transcript_36084:1767-2378(+)